MFSVEVSEPIRLYSTRYSSCDVADVKIIAAILGACVFFHCAVHSEIIVAGDAPKSLGEKKSKRDFLKVARYVVSAIFFVLSKFKGVWREIFSSFRTCFSQSK